MSAFVRAEGLGVRFIFDRLQRGMTPALAKIRRRGVETWGLSDVTFSLESGDTVALLGTSGAGKTTLLRVIAGVFSPDAGAVEVRGRIGSLLSTDAGLLGNLTGRENALLLGVLAGLSRTDSRAATQGVGDRSQLGDSYDRPVSSYSQGMRARLGLTVAEEIVPEILLLDQVHEALDHRFRATIAAHAKSIRDAGGIVVAAGHDHPLLAELCTKAMLLEDGRLLAFGPFEEVRRTYLEPADGQ